VVRRQKTMFKKFIERIIAAKDREDAINNVFYGEDGIDIAYQRGKISWKEHQTLTKLIEKLA
jgi:hydroxymethylpyrimidine pyrophosphatase-like HAD family hydrolase